MPRAIWKRILDASKSEALLAVDLYNRPSRERRVEGYFVHMHLAWLYLLHAKFQREGTDYRYRMPGSNRFVRVDGEPKTWELATCVKEHWPEPKHPVRMNLDLTIALRNRIEHRLSESQLDAATSGYAQATLLNYEAELTALFGDEHSLADLLRFPVFVGTFTTVSAERMRSAKESLPAEIRSVIAEFQADVQDELIADARYEFRVHLVQQTGPRTEADLALNFVREADLTPDERKVLAGLGRKGTVIVREQRRPVSNVGKLKPSQVVQQVAAAVPFEFNMHHFTVARKRLKLRPDPDDAHPERTVEKYCVYDEPHKDYVYTEALVQKLIREARTESGFRRLTGMEPRAPKR